MRIMTAYTFQAWIVLIRIDAFDFRPFACGIGKRGMAPETVLALTFYGEFRRFFRMLQGRAMAVFTLNHSVGRGYDLSLLFGMALPAVFLSLIFWFDGFPFFYITLSVPAIEVPCLVDAEVSGYNEGPGDQNYNRQRQHDIQGTKYMHGLRTLSSANRSRIAALVKV
jgi:hypothetical protein